MTLADTKHLFHVDNLVRTMTELKGKVNDLKPMYGAMFHDLLVNYTHWGWMDIDTVMGDLSPLMQQLRQYDVVSYPDGEV